MVCRTRIPALLLALAAALLCACGSGVPAAEGTPVPAAPAGDPAELRVTFLQAGKADAMLLRCGGHSLVLDTGDEAAGRRLAELLEQAGDLEPEVLILTHFDRDHIGGVPALLERVSPRRLLMPDYQGEGPAWDALQQALSDRELEPERLREPLRLSLGDAEVLVEPPADYAPRGGGEQDNNFSLITTVSHGEKRLVFAGDAEKRRIRQYLKGGNALPCDLLKMPHHGVYGAELEGLLDRLQPAAAVICDANSSPADARTLALLSRRRIAVYETRAGDLLVISDGRELRFEQD